MSDQLKIYNTLTRQKEFFSPLNAPFVGMYVCGPTVYGEAHLGHARSAINFDVIFRYLKHLNYKVRYVRNITDVGHLEHDADEGVDKIAKQARLESLEPMEVVQRYTHRYHQDLALLNVQSPSIEPRASGHILEQIAVIQQIIKAGFGYEVNGSVYFDVIAYHTTHGYGTLSGSVLENLLVGTRTLSGQRDKRNPLDFALWKKAFPSHLMRWRSPWGEGFPAWHIECTAIATKYLGQSFDIHGGGMDLLFPHHECELAQAQAAHHAPLAKYWLHNNLIMVNGQKMGKSLGNAISLAQLFRGTSPLFQQAYSPMTLRFFVLQAHYRNTLNVSPAALQAAHQAYLRLINGLKALKTLAYPAHNSAGDEDQALITQIKHHAYHCYTAMNDDFNTAQVIAALFRMLQPIHALHRGQLPFTALGPAVFTQLKNTYVTFVQDILGLREEHRASIEGVLHILLALYHQAKAHQQYDQVDAIRAQLKLQGIVLQDTLTGVDWYYA